MVTFYPDFYERFLCKADACKHSCCMGWEIDIDEQTARKYQAMQGALGEKIRQNIFKRENIWQFRLQSDARCPFLQADGLCYLIRNADASILCDICANHPRFFVMVGDFELAGTGLCCEKTCELLLSKQWEQSGLTFHEAGSDRSINLSTLLKRMGIDLAKEDLIYQTGMTAADAAFVLACMEKTVPIDECWIRQLEDLSDSVALTALTVEEQQLFTRLYQYILYRALEYAETYGLGAILSYAQLNADFIYMLYRWNGQLAESVRRWSEQIEYSVENVRCLMELV